jgi:hypothetical protein
VWLRVRLLTLIFDFEDQFNTRLALFAIILGITIITSITTLPRPCTTTTTILPPPPLPTEICLDRKKTQA